MNTVKITINGKELIVDSNATILSAAKENNIEIPTLCHDERLNPYGSCGMCVVEAENVPKLLRACSSKVSDGMVIRTDTPRVTEARKVALELLLTDHDGDCKAPCTLACPAGTDCQGYVGLIANGEYKEAVKLIKDKLPLPASIGRVCPHPCEKACRRQLVEDPISIAFLKSFVADVDLRSDDLYQTEIAEDTGKKVAVIGGGPGGLTSAYYLRKRGHAVTVFDQMPNMGGMLRYGIPQYRLPKEILQKEIDAIEAMGVTLKNNIHIGRDITLDEIKKDFDAVILAIGAWVSSPMGVQGENLNGVIGGIDFLGKVALKENIRIGKKVAVCGGGNTAMDACRTAVRLGAEEVYVLYRRTRSEMPADQVEIEEAEEEGVTFKFLCNPVEILAKDGKVSGVKLQKMELGEPDEGGRRRPVPIEGAFEELELDTVIMAIGQRAKLDGFEQIETTKRGTLAADEITFRTSENGVFAIGDATNKGASIAIEAIGEGQRCADSVHAFLNGIEISYKKPVYAERIITAEDLADRPKIDRAKMPHLSPEERKHNFKEIYLGFSEEQAKKEASRCLECGCHDYFECKLVRYANEYQADYHRFDGCKHHRNTEQTHPFIERNTDKCILCGLCVRVCEEVMGVTALGLIDRGFESVVRPAFDKPLETTECISCGQCVAVCPTGALRDKMPIAKSVPAQEHIQTTTCPFCNLGCQIDATFVGNTMYRALPHGEKGLLCSAGRFGYKEYTDTISVCLDGGKEISLEDAVQKLKEKISSVQKNKTAILTAGNLTCEQICEIQAFAEKNGIDQIYSAEPQFADTFCFDHDKVRKGRAAIEKFTGKSVAFDAANAKGLEKAGIKPSGDLSDYELIISFGADTDFGAYTAVIGACKETNADLFIPMPSAFETAGTYINGFGEEASVHAVTQADESYKKIFQ